MLERIRTIQWRTVWQRTDVRWALVLLLGACLWSVTGRRERVVEESTTATPHRVRAELSALPTPSPKSPRRLPHGTASAHVAMGDRAIHADFESEPQARSGTVHAAGFSAEVTANSPAWLTGTIEVDE